MKTTKHNHGPNFGKRVEGCPRCEELNAGAQPIKWRETIEREREQEFIRALKAHDCKKSNCGPVCTFGDW